MQISKKKLPSEIYSKIFNIMFNFFGKERNKMDFFIVFNELFSTKEQIMIAKRIAILYLLTKNISVFEISNILKVSKSTVSKYLTLIKEQGQLKNSYNKLIKKEKILNLLEDFYSTLISPPTRYGTDWEAGWKIEMERQRRRTFNI